MNSVKGMLPGSILDQIKQSEGKIRKAMEMVNVAINIKNNHKKGGKRK